MVKTFLLFFFPCAVYASLALTSSESLVRAYSAFDEMQENIGGELLTLFHRSPTPSCNLRTLSRAWVDPFGNWLREGNTDHQIGFVSLTHGVAAGYDYAFNPSWAIGGGGAWNESDVTLHLGKGSGHAHRYAAAFYSDYTAKNAYLGMSIYGALADNFLAINNDFSRDRILLEKKQIYTYQFTSRGKFDAYEMGTQFQGAYFFGVPACLFYPYGVFDLFYAADSSFSSTASFANQTEKVVFHIDSRSTVSVRGEAGVALQIQDLNFTETACVSPTFALGWSMECPILRPPYHWTIQGLPYSFQSQGWNQTWQLFTFQFGLSIRYRMVTIAGNYYSELSPEGRHDVFWAEWGSVRLSANF